MSARDGREARNAEDGVPYGWNVAGLSDGREVRNMIGSMRRG